MAKKKPGKAKKKPTKVNKTTKNKKKTIKAEKAAPVTVDAYHEHDPRLRGEKEAKMSNKLYEKELFHTPNIDTVGWVDVSSEKFKNILANTVSVLFPSCAEGGGGSAISCMHGGLIPVVTYESSVDINDFGVLVKNGSVEAVEEAIRTVLAFTDDELKARCLQSWQHVRGNHTKETFSSDLEQFIEHVLRA